jgi:hypothetical protein
VAPDPSHLAGFRSFRYFLTPADAFCPGDGAINTATIVRTEAGTYRREMEILHFAPSDDRACQPVPAILSCFVVETLPPRDLSAVEAQRVQQTFRTIRLDVAPVGLCSDPSCIIRHYSWDGVEAIDMPRGCLDQPLLEIDPSSDIEVRRLLDTLR